MQDPFPHLAPVSTRLAATAVATDCLRPPTPPRFHYAARIWDGVKKSSALAEYSRLLA